MQILFDDDEFDRIVHGSLPSHGEEHFAFVIKENVTSEGNPAACITFVSQTQDGPRRVQMVVTVRTLLNALHALAGKYEYLTERKWAPDNTPKTLSGHVDGIGWDAIFMERMYLIQTENHAVGVAATEEDVKAVATALCQAGKLET